jgi:hypothetical protein
MSIYKGEYSGRDKYRVCLCRNFGYPDDWESHDLWGARYNNDHAPLPPSCICCGGWPQWWDRVCGRCGNRFYQFFFHPNQRFFPDELCWTCCKLADPSSFTFWGERVKKVAPHPSLLEPKPRSLAEIREALKKL